MNVLSLFDGMSCGQQALDRLGIKVDNYFASEIDKYAIQVTMANYPNTKQLGSVVNVDGHKLPKIDLLLGGSPCQSFSFAGKRKGMSTKCETEILTLEHYLELKADGYEFEGQSYLFWEYMRLLNECKPTYFLLENVEMGEKWEKVLSKAIGVNGIHINSALVSAQNRKRIYWTNIGLEPSGLFGDLESIITQPKDQGILLKDILESEVNEKYFLSEKAITYIHRDKRNLAFQMNEDDEKSGCITAVFHKQIPYNQIIIHNTMPRSSTTGKGGTGHLSRNDGKTYCLDTGNTNAVEIKANYIQWDSSGKGNNSQGERAYFENGKCGTLSRGSDNSGQVQPKVLITNEVEIKCVAMRGRNPDNSNDRTAGQQTKQRLEPRVDNKTNCLTSVQKDNLVRQINPSLESGGKQPYQQNRVYDTDGISPALCANKSDLLIKTLNENQQKKFNPNINSDKANALTLAQGRAGSSSEYMDSVSKIANITSRIRRLTPIECERLQTVADNYTNHVSDSQRYKMLGNGWTIDVIAHILKFAKFSYLCPRSMLVSYKVKPLQ